MKEQFNVKLDVISMILLAMFMAITFILSYINSFFPSMPQGGTLSIDIIAIFLCAYLMGAGYGVVCGIGVSILQFVLGLATFYGPWSVLLDYVLPLAVCGLAPLVKTQVVKGISIYWGIVFSIVLKFICHFLSGAFLFAQPNINHYFYSFNYNFPYNFLTLIACMIIIPLLYPRLKYAFQSILR